MIEIKSTQQTEKKQIEYPIIMKALTSDLLVLFVSSDGQFGEGVALKGNDVHETGELISDWLISSFRKYNGTLELKNKE